MDLLLNRRRMIMGQNNLPYAQLDYLGFNGPQYINTLVYPLHYPTAPDFKIEYRSYCPATWGWTSQNNISNLWISSSYKSTFYRDYYSKYAMQTDWQGTWHTYKYDSTAGLYVDGTQVAQFTASFPSTASSAVNSIPLYIGVSFDLISQAVLPNETGRTQLIEYVKIWDGNILIRDYIPVLVGSVGYFYDRISGELFGNSGSGSLILPDSLNNYVQIEYLQSTNQNNTAQYIATQFIPTADTKVVFDAALNSTGVVGAFFGIYNSKNPPKRFHMGIYQNQWHFGVGTTNAATTWTNFSSPALDTARHTFIIQGNGLCSIDSTSKQINPNNTSVYDLPIHIYSQNIISGTKSYGRIRLWSLKVYVGNTLAMDLVPCRDANNVGYLFDTISKQALPNAGTGSFVLGPDI